MLNFLVGAVIAAYSAAGFGAVNLADRHRAEQIVSIFENGTPFIQYNYAAKLEDGDKRGVTFGRAGFTSCQDGAEVLEALQQIDKHNALIVFLPEMRAAEAGRISCHDSVSNLLQNGFLKLFRRLGGSEEVRVAQDTVYSRRYYQPAVQLAKKLNLRSFWSFVLILDSYVQHGEGDSGEGIEAILKNVNAAPAHNSPSERAWVLDFLNVRYKILLNGDPEWQASVGRVAVLRNLLNRYWGQNPKTIEIRSSEYGNFDL